MTGVQTLVPIMLDHVGGRAFEPGALHRSDQRGAAPYLRHGRQEDGWPSGYDADFTVVDLKTERRISNRWIASKCGWTPFDGMKVKGWPIVTVIRGHVVMREDTLVGDAIGEPLRYQRLTPEERLGASTSSAQAARSWTAGGARASRSAPNGDDAAVALRTRRAPARAAAGGRAIGNRNAFRIGFEGDGDRAQRTARSGGASGTAAPSRTERRIAC